MLRHLMANLWLLVLTLFLCCVCYPLLLWAVGQTVFPHQAEGSLVDKAGVDKDIHPTDVWMDEVEAIALQGDQEDDKRLDAAIQEIRRREKELARKKLGLDP